MIKRALAVTALGMVAFAGTASAQIDPTYVQDDTITREGETLVAGCYEGVVEFYDSNGTLLGTATAPEGGGTVTFQLPPGVSRGSVTATGTGCDTAPLDQTLVLGAPVGQALPRTGSDASVPVAQLGAGLVVAGAAAVVMARRRQRTDATA